MDYNMTVHIIEEFLLLSTRLQEVTLLPQQVDRIIWLHTSDSQYSASSAYKLQFVGMSTSMTAENVWKTKAPPRCKFFTWLMLQNRVWTAVRLLIREWPNDYFCPLCIRNLETVSHLFQDCCYSRSIWDKVGQWMQTEGLKPANWMQTENLSQWYVDLGNSGQRTKRDGLRSMIILTLWEIWKERNRRIFSKVTMAPDQLFRAIQDEARTWIRAGNKGLELVIPLALQPTEIVDNVNLI